MQYQASTNKINLHTQNIEYGKKTVTFYSGLNTSEIKKKIEWMVKAANITAPEKKVLRG